MLNMGWKITLKWKMLTRLTVDIEPLSHLVTGALWPDSSYFSGGLGIHSPGDLFSRVGAPDMNSFSASDSLLSNSLTYKTKHLSFVMKCFSYDGIDPDLATLDTGKVAS